MAGPPPLLRGDTGVLPVQPYPARARTQFGDGRLGDVGGAADIPVGIRGGQWKSAALLLDADIPGLLREGASEAPGEQSDCARNVLTLNKMGVAVPPNVSGPRK